MRRHINSRDFGDLHVAISNWSVAREHQACAVDRLIDILDCDADEAVDLLNSHSSGCELVDSKGIEIHSAELCDLPWMDGETLLVWGLIFGGVAYALSTSGITI